MTSAVPVWLVERTFSDDEQNLIIATYATPDGRQAHHKEIAVPRSGDEVNLPRRERVDEHNLSVVDDPETVTWYQDAVEDAQESE